MNSEPFTLVEEIGRGALGRVVRVHAASGDVFAGKILHASHRDDSGAAARFASEATILSDTSHPNIVEVHGIESIAGETVMRMELVDGDDLATRLALEGTLDTKVLVATALGISAGLGAAHRAGLVHRDLKPQNILLTSDGVPKIADFGMARAASFAGVDASAFAVAGTPDYMAPECTTPLAVDSRSDLYSLGCMLYEMASGKPPFSAATSFAILEAHRSQEVPALPRRVPAALRALIGSMLAKSPVDRPQSALEVERRLREIGGPGRAIEVRTGGALALSGRCVACEAPMLDAVQVCFACGESQVSLQPGSYYVVVDGPGEVGDKLDSALRLNLLAWLDANPSLGLDTEPLAKSTPRVPFVVITKRSEASARALGAALETLGLACVIGKGSPYRHPPVRKKAWRLGGRIVLIAAGSSVGVFSSSLGWLIAPLLVAEGVGGLVAGWVTAGRGATKNAKTLRSALPSAVATSVERVAPVVRAMGMRRHRDALKGVVERVLSLCETLPAERLEASCLDLARVVDVALVSCARIDEIEVALEGVDLRNPDSESLERLRERDRHAGLVLELTAFLDGLRVRVAVAKGSGAVASRDSDLDDLQAHIAALEEVQAL